MRGPSVALFAGVVLAGAVIAGCGGGGGGQASVPLAPGHPQSGNTTVQVKLLIPQKTVNGQRKPAYISPNTQSAIIEILGPQPAVTPTPGPGASFPPVVGVGYANFATSSPSCTPAPSGLSCTISISASIATAGNYSISIATLDQPQTSASCIPTPPPSSMPSASPPPPCAGYVLSEGFLVASITPGSTTPVNATLGGIPTYVKPIELLSGMIGGSSTSSTLQIYGPAPGQFQFELLDVDKNVIVGNGATNLVVSSLGGLLAVSVSATPAPNGLYTLTLTPNTTANGGQNVVTAGTATLTFTPSIMVNGLTINGPPFNLQVQVMHSVMYVARTNGGNASVDEFLDGNTTPAVTEYGPGFEQLGLAVNPNDESLWIADGSNNTVVTFPLALQGTTPQQSWTFCGIGSAQCPLPLQSGHSQSVSFLAPQYLGFDAAGDLFMSQGNNSTDLYSVMQWNAPSPGATPDAASVPVHTYTGGGAYLCHLALDNLGHMYVGTAAPSILNFVVGGSSSVFNMTNINGIAWAPDGTLWYLGVPNTPGTETIYKANASTAATITSVSGVTNYGNQSIAVDMAGNVYLADGVNNGVKEYTQASNWTTFNLLGSSQAAEFVVVFPDGLYGANHPVGVPAPVPTTYPIGPPVQI